MSYCILNNNKVVYIVIITVFKLLIMCFITLIIRVVFVSYFVIFVRKLSSVFIISNISQVKCQVK